MNKKILLLFSIFVFIINNTQVSAASLCSYKEQTELGSKAANIKVSYEPITIHLSESSGETGDDLEESDLDDARILKVSILNLTDEFYLTMTNDKNDDVKTFSVNDLINGLITFNWEDVLEVTNLTFKIYTTNKTNCPNELYKTLYVNLPRYNEYYKLGICQDLEDYSLCQEFVTFKEIDNNSFYKKIDSYRKENEKNDEENVSEEKKDNKVLEFINKNKWLIITGASLIIIVIVGIEISKKKKQGDIGL